MTTRNKTARLAGFLYLLLILFGIFNLMIVPSKLIVWNDAPTTITNLTNSLWLFKLGITAGIITFLSFLALVLVLYKLLQSVNKNQAMVMLVLVVVSIPISFVNMLNKFSVLTLLENPSYLSGYSSVDTQNQIMLQLNYFYNGVQISEIFWGLWLFPFGYLVYKSGFLPKLLGIFLMAGCFGYLIDFFGGLLIDSYSEYTIANIISIPGTIGEFGICLWLLIFGTNKIKR
ncbi:DUF4386 domain-containing protein [Eudoraea chungangensis]|uniref:DUF4386 domain-containing protein n=1 Tax=Eudoraea chungangensis TaxID=1481905 RepID=UPI0023ECC04F|nr:DUF4386 domain-containing protein [Eudoraea chungangensis]